MRIPRAELVVIAGSRHLTPFDRPAELNAAIIGLLQAEPVPPQTAGPAARAVLKHE